MKHADASANEEERNCFENFSGELVSMQKDGCLLFMNMYISGRQKFNFD